MSSEKNHEDDQSAGEPFVGRQAERFGVVHHGEQNIPGRAFSSLPVPKRKLERGFSQGNAVIGQGGNGFKLKEGWFKLDIGKRVVRLWKRLLIKTVNAPCLEVYKAEVDGALRNWFSRKHSCPSTPVGTRCSSIPFIPNRSTIL